MPGAGRLRPHRERSVALLVSRFALIADEDVRDPSTEGLCAFVHITLRVLS